MQNNDPPGTGVKNTLTDPANQNRPQSVPPGTNETNDAATRGRKKSDPPAENNEERRSDQVVYTKSYSIKGVLKGERRDIPVEDEEIGESDQVAKVTQQEKSEIVTQQEIVASWNAYAEKIMEKYPRQYSTLIDHKPVLQDNGVIRVELSTEAQQENFTMNIKPGLINYLRLHLKDMDYQFETRLAERQEMGKKVYTDEDKLAYLMQKNKGLEIFKNRFKLDFDQ